MSGIPIIGPRADFSLRSLRTIAKDEASAAGIEPLFKTSVILVASKVALFAIVEPSSLSALGGGWSCEVDDDEANGAVGGGGGGGCGCGCTIAFDADEEDVGVRDKSVIAACP